MGSPDGYRLSSFDGEGRPSPWELPGNLSLDYSWSTSSGRGILELGDWNENGHAELVQTDCYGYFHQDLDYTPYGLVDVYEANGGAWRRLSHAERVQYEETYKRIAGSGDRPLAPRPKELGMFVPDYSSDRMKGRRVEIVALAPGDAADPNCGVLRYAQMEGNRIVNVSEEEKERIRAHCEDHLVLEDGTNCYGTPGIVLIRSDTTEASLDWKSSRTRSLLKQIIGDKLPVTLTGQIEEGLCSPALIRATKP